MENFHPTKFLNPSPLYLEWNYRVCCIIIEIDDNLLLKLIAGHFSKCADTFNFLNNNFWFPDRSSVNKQKSFKPFLR